MLICVVLEFLIYMPVIAFASSLSLSLSCLLQLYLIKSKIKTRHLFPTALARLMGKVTRQPDIDTTMVHHTFV
jgi:hypothetical protein